AVLWYVSIIVVGVAAFAVLSSAVRRYPSLIPRIPPLVIGTLSLVGSTLVDRVLESRTITIDINDRGFRESSSMAEASIFALGDSFTFGWGVDAASAWPRILESITGQTIYNLGIHDSSPKQELELLDFV